MRAYLSNRDGRAMAAQTTRGTIWPEAGVPSIAYAEAQLAELEARRILADTEPQVDGEAHLTTLALLPFCGPRIGYGMGAALAESLARFVSE